MTPFNQWPVGANSAINVKGGVLNSSPWQGLGYSFTHRVKSSLGSLPKSGNFHRLTWFFNLKGSLERVSMKKFRYEFRECHKLQDKINGISLEVLLYDAYKGVNLSLIEVFNYYAKKESNNEVVPKPIKEFILSKIALLVAGECNGNELLEPIPHCSVLSRLNPYAKLNNISQINSLKFFKSIGGVTNDKISNEPIYKRSNKKAYAKSNILYPQPTKEQINEIQFKLSPSDRNNQKKIQNQINKEYPQSRRIRVRMIEKDIAILKERYARLKKVSNSLNRINKLDEEKNKTELNREKFDCEFNRLRLLYDPLHLLI